MEEAEQEWGALQGTKSSPDSSRRGRLNRNSPAAQHLNRANGEMDDIGALVFDVASFDFHRPSFVAVGVPAALLTKYAPAGAAISTFDRGPPLHLL